jgi:two-component SAPR family response regulator
MSSPARVLVVEDDEVLRDVLSDVLTARGLHVVASSRGEEALHRAAQEPFDLIVADIRMEGINGLDTIEKARELQPGIGSIVVSGFASEEETLRAVRLNVAGYLKKPFKVPELMQLINSYLASREEKMRRDGERRCLHEALLWSLEQQGRWADRVHPGQLLRPARLAARLARELGATGAAARQQAVGTLLERLQAHGGEEPPPELAQALEGFPALLRAWRGEDALAPGAFAVALCRGLAPDQPWPRPSELGEVSEPLLSAYGAFLARAEGEDGDLPDPAPEAGTSGLLALANTLERGGDLQGAVAAYQQARCEAEGSHAGLAACLGLARIAVAQGNTAQLEATMSELLTMAEKLGPVAFAESELEGATLLLRVAHPAARKLLARAVKSLARVGLEVPWAQAVLTLAAQLPGQAQEEVAPALELLARPAHRPELLERLETILPVLLEIGSRAETLAAPLVRDYPQEVVLQLRQGKLSLPARRYLVGLLEAQGRSVPEGLLDLLLQDPDAGVRASVTALKSRHGQRQALPILRVYSLGQMEVSLGEQRLDERGWKTQKTRYLFARLAYHWPRPLSVDRVMAELWPDSDEEAARRNLNTTVSIIRGRLKSTQGSFDPVLRINDTLALNPEQPLWHDVRELETSSAAARACSEAGQVEEAMSHLARVARLYRGAYLEGCYMDWANERQIALEGCAIEALDQLCLYRAGQHRHREALEYALRLLLLQPDHPGGQEVVMKSYLGLEQHEKAVSHYEGYRTRLLRETGEEPAIDLTRLYQMARYGFVQGPSFDPS